MASLTATTQRCMCCSSVPRSGGKQQQQQLNSRPAPACRNVPRRRSKSAVVTAALDGGAGVAGLLAQGVAWTAVAWYASRLLLPSKSQAEDDGPPQRECDSCGGSGFVTCWCNRWSDGDRGGCGTCSGSGRMVCSSCRGGGTAVPIEARVYIDNQRTSNFGGQRRD